MEIPGHDSKKHLCPFDYKLLPRFEVNTPFVLLLIAFALGVFYWQISLLHLSEDIFEHNL